MDMKQLLVLALVACGGETYQSGDCAEMSMQVTQVRGSCTISKAGALDIDPPICTFVQWAYCGTQCPQGWSLSCYGNPGEPERDCTYDGECVSGTSSEATFDAVQMLNGERGLLVGRPDDVGVCEFRPCL